jgi:ribonuclease D
MRIHPLITKSEDLKALVDRLSDQPYVAVDTEFMRENTYWPDLCLIQVASSDEAAAIDPKAEGIELKPLLDLFVNNPDVLKVFHAGGRTSKSSTISPANFPTRCSTRKSPPWLSAMESRSAIPT